QTAVDLRRSGGLVPEQQLHGIERQAGVPGERGPGVAEGVWGNLLVNAGPMRRASDDALDSADAQPGAAVGCEQWAVGAPVEMDLQQLPQVRREEDQPVFGALALSNPESPLAEFHVGDVEA